jgi:hypothetical protein
MRAQWGAAKMQRTVIREELPAIEDGSPGDGFRPRENRLDADVSSRGQHVIVSGVLCGRVLRFVWVGLAFRIVRPRRRGRHYL